MSKEYRFDSEKHEHWIGDIQVPGTSEIFQSLGFIDGRFYTESSRTRGQVVHACCHYLAEGDLDWGTVDPAIEPYVRAYEQFLKDVPFKPHTCEKPIWSETLLMATIPDQIGQEGGIDGIVEIKTGTMRPWTAIQTAYQALLKWPDNYLMKFRYGLNLMKDGKYNLVRFDDPDDFEIALNALSTYWWKRINLSGVKIGKLLKEQIKDTGALISEEKVVASR